MAAKKKKKPTCKAGYGRTKAGKCRKGPKRRKSGGGRKCKTIKLPGRRQRVCKRGKRWIFAKKAA